MNITTKTVRTQTKAATSVPTAITTTPRTISMTTQPQPRADNR